LADYAGLFGGDYCADDASVHPGTTEQAAKSRSSILGFVAWQARFLQRGNLGAVAGHAAFKNWHFWALTCLRCGNSQFNPCIAI
jgi:hypothetical protein